MVNNEIGKTAQQRVVTALMWIIPGALALAGVSLLVGAIGARVEHADKKERLRAEGIPVVAVIDRINAATARTRSSMNFSYEVSGVRYTGGGLCVESPACAGGPPSLQLLVDPEHPEEYLADTGYTDDSGSVLLGSSPLVLGSMFTIFGFGFIAVLLNIQRKLRRRSR